MSSKVIIDLTADSDDSRSTGETDPGFAQASWDTDECYDPPTTFDRGHFPRGRRRRANKAYTPSRADYEFKLGRNPHSVVDYSPDLPDDMDPSQFAMERRRRASMNYMPSRTDREYRLGPVDDAAFTGNQPKDSADPVHDFLPNNPIYQGEEQQKNGWMVCNP